MKINIRTKSTAKEREFITLKRKPQMVRHIIAAQSVGKLMTNEKGIKVIFTISLAGCFYKTSSDEVKRLEALGFRFEKNSSNYRSDDIHPDGHRITTEINTLEELLAFQKKYGDLIIEKDNEITIYDDYVE